MRAYDADDFNEPPKALPLLTMGSNFTFSRAEIAAYYRARVPELKLRGSGESRGPCPIHKGGDNNFAVNVDTGEWFCHSQCQRGGDIFALEAALTDRDFPSCKAEVFGLVGRKPGHRRNGAGGSRHSKWNPTNGHSPRAATKSQQEAPQPARIVTADQVRKSLARQGFHAVAEHQYGPNLRKVRFEHESAQQEDKSRPEKTYRWEHCVDAVWHAGDGGVPKPLYINDVFRERDQVEFALGFEGEAKADLAGELGYAAFSFKDITKEQALSLVGCDVVLWPDNDESGAQQAQKAARTIDEADQIRSIKLVTPPPGLPEGGDIIDAVRRLGWDKARIAQLLESACDYQSADPADSCISADSAQSPGDDKATQSQLLIECAAGAELFHNPEGEGFACLPVGEHREVWPLKSRSCRRWLARAFYRKIGKPPGSQAMHEALALLEARAQFDSPENSVFTRVAPYGDAIYIDLGNDRWQAVEITNKGWNVVQDPPVRFRRSKGMQPLPDPAQGRPISNLRSLINIGDDRNWILVLSWLVSACRPQGPYPLLILQGEQGSAKSTTARLLRRIIDPATAPLRTPPRDERDLLIAANNSWVVAYDNLSGIQQWLSDGLCRLATGGGLSTRELYTDTDEVILDLTRPVILNGIDHLAERPDLADRAIFLNLPRIEETARRDEAELFTAYERERPYILGALLDAVSVALARLPEVRLHRKPRMADFALWASAAEPALGCETGAFMSAYSGNRAEAVQETLDSDPVSAAIVVLINDEHTDGQWTGTAGDLLNHLEKSVEEGVRRSPAWPKTPRAISSRVRRLVTFLRESGIEITFGPKGTGGRRPLTIKRTAVDFIATTATTAYPEPASSSNQPFAVDSTSGGRGL